MKKVCTFLLVIILSVLFCACGTEETKEESGPSIKDRAIACAEKEVRSKVNGRYDVSGIACETTSAREVKENRFEVSGKVYAKDKYGDISWAKYDGTVFFYESDGRFSAVMHVSALK